MPTTERLYYNDSHLIEFEARVLDVTERVSGWTAVVLDRTAFYPTGGGQPSDTGTLNGSRVVECIDDGERGVLHVMQATPPPRDAIVSGRVDWSRRLDHMQQHTGQHILSQAFIKLFNAPTKSFRVLETSCEIDIELSNPTTEVIERAVELANNVVWEDRAITIHNVSKAEAEALPLRKESSREGELRLIEIDDFDLTPCGGTHAYRTGEVGMIAMRSWERAKGLTRVEFVAGTRALADYRTANRSAREVAALFSTGRDDAPQHASQLVEENRELHRQVRALEEMAAGVEAERLLSMASVQADGTRVVTHIFGSGAAESNPCDAEFLKKVAHALVAHPRTITLLASVEGGSGEKSSSGEKTAAGGKGPSGDKTASGDKSASGDKNTARLVFARSADAPGDMNALMREACALLDGRGGGRPELAQGGGRNVERLHDALDRAAGSLLDV